MRIYEFITLIVKVQHVSVNCGHLQEGVFTKNVLQRPMYRYQILSFKYVIHNVLKQLL